MNDEAVHARANGKSEVRQNTIWELRIGNFSVRCIREDFLLVVQAKYHSQSGYRRISTGTDAKVLLDKLLTSKGVVAVLAEQQKSVMSR